MRAPRLLSSALLVAGLVLAGCGGDSDDDASTDPAAETTEDTAASPTSDDEGATTSEDEGEVEACADDLVIAGSDADDGPVEVAMAITDEGPHPDNTVDYDATLEGAIATYDLEADPQFGLGVPVGVPEVPGDGLIYVFHLSLEDSADTIAAGDTFSSSTDPSAEAEVAGRITNHGLFSGTSGRINPLGDTTIEITEITDEQVCGTITAVTDTDLQTFATLTGTFTAERVQFLEAEG